MADIEFDRTQAVPRQGFLSLRFGLAKLAHGLFRRRKLRLYRDELSPHLARDLGLSDGMEKPILSTGIIEQAPRV